MRLTTAWGVLGVLTAAGLLYTHSQVRLVHQSYRLNQRLELRDTLHEQYAFLEYDVMALKAPNRLKERLTSMQVELQPPKATEFLVPVQAAPGPTTREWAPRWLRALEAEATDE